MRLRVRLVQLDRMIAVNPLWERREHAWSTVAAEFWQRAGSSLTLSAADYRSAWQEGRISEHHLQQALAEQAESWNTPQLLQVLEMPPEANAGLPLLGSRHPVTGLAGADHPADWPVLRRLV